MSISAGNIQLQVKIGQASFNACGPEDVVLGLYEEFLGLVEADDDLFEDDDEEC